MRALDHSALWAPLRLLVIGQRLRRIDVAQGRMRRHQLASGLDVEALGEDRAERLDLHLAEAGQAGEVRPQLVRAARPGPDARRVAVVAVADPHREVVDALGHRARKPVDRRLGAEHGLEIGRGERVGVERAEALAQLERPGERLLHRDLLVEGEAHQQRHRIGGDQRVGLIGVGEEQALRHAPMVSGRRLPFAAAGRGSAGNAWRAERARLWNAKSTTWE